MKKLIAIIFIIILCSCRIQKADISNRKYSTGHMGMPGENAFVFKSGNQFYYYERLGYSEGTFEWIDNKSIKLTSKTMGFDIPYKDNKYYRNLCDKIVVFKGNKLLFEGFNLRKAKE